MSNLSYKTTNWKEYNEGLKQRGSLTLWFDPSVAGYWLSNTLANGRGRTLTYSDLAIETMATVQALTRYAGRQLEGFFKSLFDVLKLDVPVPEHSTVSRRLAKLTIELKTPKRLKGCHVVIDSTGVKIYGEGEWKVRQHGKEKRRKWRKLHVGVDEATLEIVAAEMSDCNIHDCELVGQLFEEAATNRPGIVQVSGDGAYDSHESYDLIEDYTRGEATITIPPRKTAVCAIERDNPTAHFNQQRDTNVKNVQDLGQEEWKKEYGYHRRSLAETTMHRFKKIFTGTLSRRTQARQRSELRIKCSMLNVMIRVARPKSEPKTARQ